MGRQPWTSRITVEECPIQLPAVELHRFGVFRLPPGTSSTIFWQSIPDGSPVGRLNYEIRSDGSGGRAIFILRQVLSFDGSLRMGSGQTIPLTTTRPHLGGERFWFVCECGRRAGRLYLPAGQTVFRCRLCCDLTYQSAQEHNTRAAKLRPIVEWYRREMERAEARARKPRPPHGAHRRPLWKT
jgi:hypothetical protein